MHMFIPIDQSFNESLTGNFPVLQFIGSGSFATVFTSHGGACVFKVVRDPKNAGIIANEYMVLLNIHRTCDINSFFKLPQPYVFYNPTTGALDASRHLFSAKTFRLLGITNASYAMDRLFALPLTLGHSIRHLYYPDSFKRANLPTLCRLYFGKVIDVGLTPHNQEARPVHSFNTMDVPLDTARYTVLDAIHCLPDLHEVIAGMGDMLARIHWLGNCDARNIEWVMSGDGYGDEVSYSVIDFEQTKQWGKTLEGVDMLVTAFMTNEPYYPRPRPQDPQYQIFKTAYPTDQAALDVALAFLTTIEHEQAQRDAEPTYGSMR
ncbi:hypothetical protein Clacol_009418 [Clathrus columnatus]|uniref:DUF3669 domain-containing protein n=1 Tax=Clathrus columnatus TaxID=1419009 RepID=A0AAV5AQ24_9AGAM|nr:hypothetical protein Clacol_009418 [Clathrus columnatus]